MAKAAPANMKFYFNAATLVLFLIFSIPGINQRVNYAREGKTQGKDSTGALAAVSLGIFILLTPAWAGPSHTFQGENWVDLLRTELNLSGGILLGQGALLVARDLVGLCRGGSLVPTIRILMRS